MDMAGEVRLLHGKQRGATGGVHRLGAFQFIYYFLTDVGDN